MLRCRARGFTYIGLLIFIALAGIGLAMAGVSWQHKVRAEKEQQLLFVGNEYRKAIKSYYESAPFGVKTYPSTFQDLLLDKRFPVIKRHLRRLYPDPMTGKPEWGVYKQQGVITAVFSLSEEKPFKVAKFSKENQGFAGATSYRTWIFGLAGGTMQVLSLTTGESVAVNKANVATDETQTQQTKNDSSGVSDTTNTNITNTKIDSSSTKSHRVSPRIPLE